MIIIFCAILLIVPVLVEPSFENLFALLGALGIVLGFAFKDYISSLIAGIVTLFEITYRPGDWIEIDGHYGEVREIGMRSTEIVTPDDTVIIVPHLKMWNGLIANSNDGSRNLMCVANYYLLPNHDSQTVISMLYDVALTSVYLQLQRPVLVLAQEKPYGTHYRLKAYPIDPRDQFLFISFCCILYLFFGICVASLCARFDSGMLCNQILPGPVSVARNNPSPPNSMFLIPFTRVMS